MKIRLLLLTTMLLSEATFAQDISLTLANASNYNSGTSDFDEVRGTHRFNFEVVNSGL